MNNLKFAIRQLLKAPGVTTIALITLALGLGATTAIFSVVNAVLMRPLPYAQPEQLVRLYTEFPTFPNGGLRRFPFSQPEYLDLKREASSWAGLEGWSNNGVNLARANEPTRATACFVTGGMLNMLGVGPARGRLLDPSDDRPGAPLAATISHELWQRFFGGRADVIGLEMLLNGSKCTVIGVMPRGFQFPPGQMDSPELWVPQQINPAQPGERSSHGFSVLGRLKAGVPMAQARDELNGLVKRSQESTAPTSHGFHVEGHTIVGYGLHDEVVRSVRPALRMLLGAVGFVLLIACVNVANLLSARAEARRREMAIRGALGATWQRLAFQFVVEGLVLSAAGAALGLLLAHVGLHWLTRATEASLPRAGEIGIDSRVLLFALALCLVTGILFGLAPLLHVLRRDLLSSLQTTAASTTEPASRHRFRHALVVSQLALALVLLIGTGLMLRAFWNLQQVNPGFEGTGVVTAQLSLPRSSYPDASSRLAFWSRLQERLAGAPGVRRAGLASDLPPQKATSYTDTDIEGFVPVENGPVENVDFYSAVSPEYFRTFNIRLVEGRLFEEGDGPGKPDVVVINQTLARTFWGGESPIGRRLRPGRGTNAWCTVIGVVEDVKNHGLDQPIGTEVYLAHGQTYAPGERSLYVTLRSRGDPAAVLGALRQTVREVDPTLPLARVRTMDHVMAMARSRPHFLTSLLTLFALVALILAAVGVYGTISYSVAQRTKEFGVRLALGAQRGHVLQMVLRRGLALALGGIAAGLLGAIALTRSLTTLLFGVTPTDPATFFLVSGVLAAVAALATYIPARRATRIDPMVALRYE